MRKVVVDTNIIIDHLRKKDRILLRVFEEAQREGLECLISGITIAELFAGKEMDEKGRIGEVLRLIDRFATVLPDIDILTKAGELMRKRKQLLIGDAIIAATAILEKARLTTMNKKDFARITELKFYQLK